MKMNFNTFQNNQMLNNVEQAGWKLFKLTDLLKDDSRNALKIKKRDYIEKGSTPIIDQGKRLIGGYSNIEDGFYMENSYIVFGDHTRILKYIDFPAFIGADGVKVLKNIDEHVTNTKYLYYFLKTVAIPDTGYNRHFKFLKEVVIPVPKLDTQLEIVNLLDKVNIIKNKRQQQIEALSALKQSVYYGMLNSFKKEKFKLKDILKIDTVTMKDFTENPEYYLIGIDNIEKDTGRIINHKKITETSVKGSKHYFNEKHVLYSKIRPYLNKVATPTFEGVCSTDCYPLLVDETKATKEFVVLLLRSQEFVSYANSQSTGANIPRINQTKLLNYNFLMPNLEIQHRIKEKVNKIDQSILLMENSLEQINLLYDSILHKAFNGELFKEDINV